MNKQLIILLIVLLSLNFSCKEEKNGVTVINDETFQVKDDNEKVKLAVKDAQDSLDYYIEKYKKHSKDSNYWFTAKTPFEDVDNIEHMWFEVFDFEDNNFKGILLSEPYWVKNIKSGDTISIKRDAIEDWYILNETDNTVEGNFTEKHLFNEENK